MRFEYLEPATLKEATALLGSLGGEAKILAGGTDLLKHLKDRTLRPKFVVNIKGLPGLGDLSYRPGEGLHIGALVTMHALERYSLLKKRFAALAEAACLLGSPQVRNLATIGGNLCNAAPSAESAPALLCFSASVDIAGSVSARTLPLASFFAGPGKTVLREGEVLTGIFIPDPPPCSGSIYLKHCPRGLMDVAIVGVAVSMMRSTEEETVASCSIGLGATAPTPVRAGKAEAMLLGKKPTPDLIQEAARAAAEESDPLSDIRGSAEYRRRMVRVFVVRALRAAAARAGFRDAVLEGP